MLTTNSYNPSIYYNNIYIQPYHNSCCGLQSNLLVLFHVIIYYYARCFYSAHYMNERMCRATRQRCVRCTTTVILSLQHIIISYTCTCVTYESALYMQFSNLYRTCIMWSHTCIQCSIVIAHFCTYTCTYMYVYVHVQVYMHSLCNDPNAWLKSHC